MSRARTWAELLLHWLLLSPQEHASQKEHAASKFLAINRWSGTDLLPKLSCLRANCERWLVWSRLGGGLRGHDWTRHPRVFPVIRVVKRLQHAASRGWRRYLSTSKLLNEISQDDGDAMLMMSAWLVHEEGKGRSVSLEMVEWARSCTLHIGR